MYDEPYPLKILKGSIKCSQYQTGKDDAKKEKIKIIKKNRRYLQT